MSDDDVSKHIRFKNTIETNHIHNCPISVDNIDATEDIFGKEIFALKGKMTRHSPFAVTIDTMDIPPEIVKSHNIFLGVNIFHPNPKPQTPNPKPLNFR